MLSLSGVFAVLTPLIVIICGKILYKNADCDINSVFGYRTSRSMKSRENWIFANELCGKILFYGGIVSAFVSICAVFLAYIISGENTAFWTSVAVNLLTAVILFAIIPYIEDRLKKFEDENKNKNVKD